MRARPFFRYALGCAIIVLAVYAAWSAWEFVEEYRLKAAIERARASGALAGIALGPPPSEFADDAARIYRAADDLLPSRDYRRACSTLQDPEHRSREATAAVQAILDESATALDLVTKARTASIRKWRLPYGRYNVGLSNLAGLLAFRACIFSATGKIDDAARSVADELRLTRAFDGLETPPWSVPFANRIFLASRAVDNLEMVLRAGRPSIAVLDDLAQVLDREWDADVSGNARWMLGQIVFQSGYRAVPGIMRPLLLSGEARSIPELTAIVDVSRLPWPANLRRLEELEGAATGREYVDPFHLTTKQYFHNTVQSAKFEGTSLGRIRCARVAVAIERARAATGHVPGTLAELVPAYLTAIPQDPFTGRELLYRADSNEVVVYSVGEDRKDDGGSVTFGRDTRGEAERPQDVGIRIGTR